jgi:hypothetical protein
MEVEALQRSEWRQKDGGKKMKSGVDDGIRGIHGRESELFAISTESWRDRIMAVGAIVAVFLI